MTITIIADVTATMSNEKVNAYYEALEATKSRKAAYYNENLDRYDIMYLEEIEYEAWERFFK